MCSLCIFTYCNFVISQLGFEEGTLVLIASVPGHCLSLLFANLLPVFDVIKRVCCILSIRDFSKISVWVLVVEFGF